MVRIYNIIWEEPNEKPTELYMSSKDDDDIKTYINDLVKIGWIIKSYEYEKIIKK